MDVNNDDFGFSSDDSVMEFPGGLLWLGEPPQGNPLNPAMGQVTCHLGWKAKPMRHSPGDKKSAIQVLVGRVPSEGSRGASVAHLS